MRVGGWVLIGFLTASACRDEEPRPFEVAPIPSASPVPASRSGPDIRSDQSLTFRYGPETSATPSPPPLSGGTLIVTRNDRFAVASDPDRDRIWIADIASGKLVGSIPVQAGDEPGRLVEDNTRHVHIALRRGSALLTISLDSLAPVARRATCAEPRGVAFEGATGLVHVACLSGDLLSFQGLAPDPVRRIHLTDDLRDVVVRGDRLWVSRFKAAEVLVVGPGGAIENTIHLANYIGARDGTRGAEFTPSVAYRMAPLPTGGVAIVHQRGSTEAVNTDLPGGYIGQTTCDSRTVHSTITLITPDGLANHSPPANGLVVPVDVAISPDGARAIAVAPGGIRGRQALSYPISGSKESVDCMDGTYPFASIPGDVGELVAAAFDTKGNAVFQSREPAAIHVVPSLNPLAQGFAGKIEIPEAVSVADFGHAVFHRDSGGGVACASCHPEGHEDGRTWFFQPLGKRRTQSLRVGLEGTAPFHWDGTFSTLHDLTSQVFVKRMRGPELSDNQTSLLTTWVESIRPFVRDSPSDQASFERGRALFMRADVGCVSCHAGPKYTNNQTVDVGTGGAFQVPSLVDVSARAPFLHDGCALTLADRFARCGGGDRHGQTSNLTTGQIDDLIAFLSTL